ncbi:hypothetical protein BDZ89DRAFT_945652, partial [Hymenopellis radicata]
SRRFLYESKRITEEDTPGSLEMENDVMMECESLSFGPMISRLMLVLDQNVRVLHRVPMYSQSLLYFDIFTCYTCTPAAPNKTIAYRAMLPHHPPESRTCGLTRSFPNYVGDLTSLPVRGERS